MNISELHFRVILSVPEICGSHESPNSEKQEEIEKIMEDYIVCYIILIKRERRNEEDRHRNMLVLFLFLTFILTTHTKEFFLILL